MNTVIKVDNLSKRYYLSHKQKERFPTFRDDLVTRAGEYGKRLLHPFQALSGQTLKDTSGAEEFWALKDISFEVKQGDRVGIIGSNGAGKSTLLKILSRITAPTSGCVSIKGRVASLLEVGTGFHPELTGRENIFLNGAILGMGKQEIKRKFDEIVDFAEVEKFLDTPVKRYSSGMYVRLAFAVAAHLEPEILIVDEVLAVGDAQFQKKCLGKMEDVSRGGRTVLFVSHNMAAVSGLCDRGILLNNGILESFGDVQEILDRYVSMTLGLFRDKSRGVYDYPKRVNPCRNFPVIIQRMTLTGKDGTSRNSYCMGESINVHLELAGLRAYPGVEVSVTIKTLLNQRVATLNTGMSGFEDPNSRERGPLEVWTLSLGDLPLTAGYYAVEIIIAKKNCHYVDYIKDAGVFTVVDNDFYGTGYAVDNHFGVICLAGQWSVSPKMPVG